MGKENIRESFADMKEFDREALAFSVVVTNLALGMASRRLVEFEHPEMDTDELAKEAERVASSYVADGRKMTLGALGVQDEPTE